MFKSSDKVQVLLWGNKDGRLYYIDEVANGLDCNCTCNHCGNPLVAKNQGTKKVHHFAHSSGIECAKAVESAVHKLAKQILSSNLLLMLPALEAIGPYGMKEYIPKTRIKFETIDIEKSFAIQGISIRPDVIGYFKGKQIFIEFCFTHSVDEYKRSQILKSNMSCVEIMLDISLQDPQKMQDFLEKSVESRHWIFHKAIDRIVQEDFKKEEERLKGIEKERIAKENERKRLEAVIKKKAEQARERLAFKLKEKQKIEERKKDLALNEARKKGNLYLNCPITNHFLKYYLHTIWGNNNIIQELQSGNWFQNKIFYYWPDNDIDIFINEKRYVLVPKKEEYDKLDIKQQKYHDRLLKSVEKYSVLLHRSIDFCSKCRMYAGREYGYIICRYKEGVNIGECLNYDAL
jgi:competence CoiA-like predicted nuclease